MKEIVELVDKVENHRNRADSVSPKRSYAGVSSFVHLTALAITVLLFPAYFLPLANTDTNVSSILIIR